MNKEEENKIHTPFDDFFISNSEEEDKISTKDANFPISPTQVYLGNPLPHFYAEESIQNQSDAMFNAPSIEILFEKRNIKEIFRVEHKEAGSLFNRIENESSTEEEISYQQKRHRIKRRRREHQDNIRKKIKRNFLNKALIKKINSLIKNKGDKILFEKFQQHFVSDVTRKSNKQLINMTLAEIFKKKELYHVNELKYYYHNLELVNSKNIQENNELKNILDKTYKQIFEEYLNSKEFKIDEINRLKKNKMDNEYIKKYKYLAKHFIEFYSE